MIARIGCIFFIYDGTLYSFGLALVLAQVLLIPVNLIIQKIYLDTWLKPFVNALLPSLAVTLVCGSTGWIVHAVTPAVWPDVFRLLVLAFALGPLWLVAVVLARHPFVTELERIGERFTPLAIMMRLISRLRP